MKCSFTEEGTPNEQKGYDRQKRELCAVAEEAFREGDLILLLNYG